MSEPSFLTELALLQKPVWEKIQDYLPDREPRGHYMMMREYPERLGKYLRPGLMLLATELYGGKTADALLLAAAIQVSEDWLLIHDDIEDHSEERRHKPTLHRMYGEELALNAGDALHIVMWKIVGDAVRSLDSTLGWRIFNIFNETLLKTTEGQYYELKWIFDKTVSISTQEYVSMVERKTVNYTTTTPVLLGALIAGVDEKEVSALTEWTIPFGYAFQIWDDYMNIQMATASQGKECAGDILEGKRTLILIHLLEHCSESERKEIERIYRMDRSQKTEEEKNYILTLIETYGSALYARDTARDFGAQAIALFDAQTQHLAHKPARDILRAGIAFVTNREH